MIISALLYSHVINSKLIFVTHIKVQAHPFACEDPVVPVPLAEQTVLSLTNCLGTFVKNQMMYQYMSLSRDSQFSSSNVSKFQSIDIRLSLLYDCATLKTVVL